MKRILIITLFMAMGSASFAQQKANIKTHVQPGVILVDTPHHKSDMTLLTSPAVSLQQDTSRAIRIRPDQVVWKDAPSYLPAGAKVASLEGSSKEAGLFTIRMKLPPHWLLSTHWHPADERVTVLSGSVYIGFGEKLDSAKATKFSTGSYYTNPVKSHHYLFTGSEETILQITGQGPWNTTFIEEGKGK